MAATRAVSAKARVGKVRKECLRGERLRCFNRLLPQTLASLIQVLALRVGIQSVSAQALQSGRWHMGKVTREKRLGGGA